jgi:hypothetical protein
MADAIITSANPIAAQLTTSVTISGSGFEAAQGGGSVTIGGVAATVSSWSATAIVVVPGGGTGLGIADVVVTPDSNTADTLADGVYIYDNTSNLDITDIDIPTVARVLINGINVGYTTDTYQYSPTLTLEQVRSDQYRSIIKSIKTEVSGTLTFTLLQIDKTNLARALGGEVVDDMVVIDANSPLVEVTVCIIENSPGWISCWPRCQVETPSTFIGGGNAVRKLPITFTTLTGDDGRCYMAQPV